MRPTAEPIDSSVLLAQRGWVRALAAALVADPDRRDDVVQETWRVALERPPREREPFALRRWLATVVRNLVRQSGRVDGTRRWHEAQSARERVNDTSAVEERLDLETRLSEALRALDEPYREAVVLRYLDGLSYPQVAERTGVTPAAASQRISRGLAKLRERFDGERGGRRAWCAAFAERLLPGLEAGTLATQGLFAGARAPGVAATVALVVLAAGVVGVVATWSATEPAPAEAHALAALEPRHRYDTGLPSSARAAIPVPPAAAQEAQAPETVAVEAPLSAPAARDVAAEVEAYLAPLVSSRLFAGSVLLARGGEVLHVGGYGLAEEATREKNVPSTSYKLMSVTKSFTAVAIYTLQREGLLDVDDPVRRHLEPWPAAWADVTIRELLGHASAIPNLDNDWGARVRRTGTRGLALWRTAAADLGAGTLERAAASGTGRYAYSNFNYVLLGLVIEHVTGRPYAEYLKEAVLEPAGLVHTGHDRGGRPAGLAMGYFRGRGGALEASRQDMSVIEAAGDLYSSVEDLYRLDRALTGDRLLSAELRAEMVAPIAPTYGSGWQRLPRAGRTCIGHSGGANGYVAELLRFPDQDACVVVLSNFAYAPVGRVADDLTAILFGEPHEVPVTPDETELGLYDGIYHAAGAPLGTFVVRRSGNALLLFLVDDRRGDDRSQRCGARLLFPVAGAEFVAPWGGGRLRFVVDDPLGGHVVHRMRSRETVMPRVALAPESWRRALGEYRTEPRLGSSVQIEDRAGALRLVVEGGWPAEVELAPVTESTAIALVSETFGTLLHLERGPEGGIDLFRWERADGTTFRGAPTGR